MASVQKLPSGKYRIQFVDGDGRRQSVFLGKVTKHAADSVAIKVESLNAAKISRQAVDREVAEWVGGLNTVMHDRLAEVGLVTKRETGILGAFVASYLEQRSDVKPATATFYAHTKRNLVDYFGEHKPMRDVTPGDADEFRLWLMRPTTEGGQGLSDNTARRRCALAGQFFRAAQRKGLIGVNPFQGVGGIVRANKARQFFVDHTAAEAVLKACPNNEWRLIFALSRFGGLRTPSEHYGLRWADVDWANGKFLVHSPKTAHHENGATRWVPIFPELRPYLEKAFDDAPEGTEYVILRNRNQANLRTQFTRIVKRAGLTPWEKLFHNLRSSRQTELAAVYPLYMVCSWLGNKAAIAAEHYLQVTEADYVKASSAVCTTCAVSPETDEIRGNDENDHQKKMPGNPGNSSSFSLMANDLVGNTGLEPVTPTV